jgi:hypothetical protein
MYRPIRVVTDAPESIVGLPDLHRAGSDAAFEPGDDVQHRPLARGDAGRHGLGFRNHLSGASFSPSRESAGGEDDRRSGDQGQGRRDGAAARTRPSPCRRGAKV